MQYQSRIKKSGTLVPTPFHLKWNQSTIPRERDSALNFPWEWDLYRIPVGVLESNWHEIPKLLSGIGVPTKIGISNVIKGATAP